MTSDGRFSFLIDFFVSCVEDPLRDCCVSEFKEDHYASDILSDIRSVMSRPASEHVRSRRLAFGSSEQLVYPEGTQEIKDYSATKTVILQHLELSGLTFQSLAVASQRRLKKKIALSCYISSPTSDAFGWHRDEWDSLIWQLSGTKTFCFQDGSNFSLESGRLLFIRQGVIHKTHSETSSIHLSVTARS